MMTVNEKKNSIAMNSHKPKQKNHDSIQCNQISLSSW